MRPTTSTLDVKSTINILKHTHIVHDHSSLAVNCATNPLVHADSHEQYASGLCNMMQRAPRERSQCEQNQ
jgi:hypothetical protein